MKPRAHRLLALALTLCATGAHAADSYGPRLEGFDYPWPVHTYRLQSQRQALEMAYLDVPPRGAANGRTAVLLHGKNFCAATWQHTIEALTDVGYRVIAPDQIGFCKSSKPAAYQFSLAQLAANTHALLEALGVQRAIVVGHSMGGMLGIRYALTYPQAVERLALVNPIGLEDWKAAGVPWQDVDAWYTGELKTDYDSIKRYQLGTYYAGHWTAEFEHWARMQAGMYAGPGREQVAWNQALTYDMVLNQPVVHELGNLKVPTTLFIGQKDNTAIGKALAPPEVRASLGNYPVLGRRAAATIPGATLVEFDDLGHSPQVQAPQRFNTALLDALR